MIWKCQKWLQLKLPKNGHSHELPEDGIGAVQAVGSIFFISNGHSAVLAMEDGLCHCWPDYLAFFMALPLMVFWYILVAGFLVVTALASWLVAGFLVVPALDSWFILVAGFLVVPALDSWFLVVPGSLVMGFAWAGHPLVHTCWYGPQSMVPGTSGSMEAHTACGATPRTGCTFGMQWPKMALEA